jgi:hypothetical protein
MGRSGGQKKLLLKTNAPTRTKAKSYLPGPDHEQLVFDAVEIWIQDPRYLIEGEAHMEWTKFLGENKLIDRNNPKYWQRAKEALFYQARNSVPDVAPIFRGQPFLSDHPFDRARGWSPDLDTAFGFITNHLIIEDDHQTQEINLFAATQKARAFLDGKTKEDLFSGRAKLTAAVYVIENPEMGLSLNGNFLRAPRKKEALAQFENGNLQGCFYYINEETGQWQAVTESADMIELKSAAANFIANKLSREEAVNHISFLPEDIDIDHSLGYLIESGSSLEDIDNMLQLVGDREKLNSWREETEQIREVLQSKENLSYGLEDCYLDENEVIVPPEGASGMRRVEVVVAESNQELAAMSAGDVQIKIQQAVESRDFINPSQVSPGQKRLFSLN